MAYTVTITYTGPATDSINVVLPISPTFFPTNSYVDSTAYAGTVYDTNVEGWGTIDLMEPYKTTSFPFPVPLAQFKVAAVGTSGTVTFTVDTYMEAFWYTQAGIQLKDQGFTVEVEEAEG